MIRIAIYNDGRAAYANNALIHSTLSEQRIVANVSEYQNEELLLADMQKFECFDLIFLSTEETQMRGIALAKEIKQVLPNSLIVFISSHVNYVFEAFEVPVFRFIFKNELSVRLNQAVQDAVLLVLSKKSPMYFIESKDHIDKILVSEIVYITKRRNDALFMSVYGQLCCRKNLNEIYMELKEYEFHYINRGCIVNIFYVKNMLNGVLEMKDGTKLSVSRSNKKRTMQTLLSYWRRDVSK